MNKYVNDVLLEFKDLENDINAQIKALSQNINNEEIFRALPEDTTDDYKYTLLNREKIHFLKNNLTINKNFSVIIDKDSSLSTIVFVDKDKKDKYYSALFNRVVMAFEHKATDHIINTVSSSSRIRVNDDISLEYVFDSRNGISVGLVSLRSSNFSTLYFNKKLINQKDYHVDDPIISQYTGPFRTLIELSHEKELLVLDYLFGGKDMSKEETEILNLVNDINIKDFDQLKLNVKLEKNKKTLKIKI